MAERLKSISNQISWSLALRALASVAAWYVLPQSLFLLAVLGLYFVPWFRPGALLAPFGVTLWFMSRLEPTPGLAMLFVAVWFLIYGIKELVFVERARAYEALLILLAFLIFLSFFSGFSAPGRGSGGGALAVGFVYVLLMRGLLREATHRETASMEGISRRIAIASVLGGLLMTEVVIAALFLPMNFFSQSALALLTLALLTSSLTAHLEGTLTRNTVLTYASLFLVGSTIILLGNPWGAL